MTEETFSSYKNASYAQELLEEGKAILSSYKAGCIVLAGGQGTRLGFDGPKGTIPILNNRSLFQILAEKVTAASEWVGHPLPLSIMTSPQNDKETKAFFQKHGNFGLKNNQLTFFSQKELPILNDKGNPFFSAPKTQALGPDGNGHVLKQFVQEGIASDWSSKGVQFVNVIQVDNPLADPFPLELLARQKRERAEIGAIAIEREDPKESVGIWVLENALPKIIEYSEISEEEQLAMDPTTKKLKHPLANISHFCFSMSFIFEHSNASLPLHKAHKKSPYLDDNGQIIQPKEPNAWKSEYFIFDWLPFAKKTTVLVYPREECFAPLKNAKGKDSLKTVKAALKKQKPPHYF